MYFSIKRIRDSYWTKGFSLLMGLNLLVQPLIPSVSYAITGGPSQPEFTQFSPVTADNVVDPYTGNFQYNIPLMTVPGPNGGYPINLSYASDVTMDQEASWVGLGWNVNVGAINRQLRGLPDDFDGDVVSKNVNLKDREVYSMEVTGNYKELFGSKFLGSLDKSLADSTGILGNFPSSIRLFYDNYNGFGYSLGANIPGVKLVKLGMFKELRLGLGLNFDSQGGTSYMPSLGLTESTGGVPMFSSGGNVYSKYRSIGGIGATISSRAGLESIRINANRSKFYGKSGLSSSLLGASFPMVDNVPNVGIQTNTETDKIAVNIGEVSALGKVNYPLPLIMNKTVTSLVSSTFNDYAYGYLNTEKASDQSLTDFQTSGNIIYNKKVPNLDPSILTYDIYNVSGQGMSGVFRAYRNEVAVYSQEESITTSEELSIDTEAGVGAAFHLGLGITDGSGIRRSGNWQDGTTSVDGLDHEGKQSPEDEPYSFVMISEKNVQRNQEDILDDWNADDPVRVRLGEYNGWANKKFEADQIEAHSGSSFLYNPTTGSSNKRTNRIRRETSIKALKGDEVYDFGFSKYVEYYDKGTGTWIDKEMTGINRGHHINEYSITQTDGSVYTYGLPAYNQTRVDANFRVEENAELDLPTSQTGLDVQRITKVKV
ncbi:MAG: hypothetical protein MI810_19075, partial [Flavobacteriales bacterium]|nr:hypothetical protein [Flavobacteriales bacterium]